MHPSSMKRTEGMLSASWQSPSLKLGSQLSASEADAAVVLSRKCQRRDATDSWRRATFTTLPALREQAQQEVILCPFKRAFPSSTNRAFSIRRNSIMSMWRTPK